MKYKIVLFDADGVLLPKKFSFSDKLARAYGIDFDRLQPFFKGPFADCRIGRADLKEELTKVLAEWGWKGTVEELMQFWFTEGTEVDPEVLAVAMELRDQGVSVCMTSDQEKYRGASLRQRFGDEQPFQEIFTSSDIGCVKKDPRFFEHVYQALCEEQGIIAKDQILLVDDGEDNIEVGKAFGFDTYLYKNLADFKTFLAE